MFGGNCFEVVSTFKYLGLMFDHEANPRVMVADLLAKGVKVFHWLRKFVSQNGWRIPHTRLVLLNVYVRAVL